MQLLLGMAVIEELQELRWSEQVVTKQKVGVLPVNR